MQGMVRQWKYLVGIWNICLVNRNSWLKSEIVLVKENILWKYGIFSVNENIWSESEMCLVNKWNLLFIRSVKLFGWIYKTWNLKSLKFDADRKFDFTFSPPLPCRPPPSPKGYSAPTKKVWKCKIIISCSIFFSGNSGFQLNAGTEQSIFDVKHLGSMRYCIRAPPKRGRYWEIHPRRPRDFPRPKIFPKGFAPSFLWSMDTLLNELSQHNIYVKNLESMR